MPVQCPYYYENDYYDDNRRLLACDNVGSRRDNNDRPAPTAHCQPEILIYHIQQYPARPALTVRWS